MLTLQQWNCVSCDNETLATKRLKFVAAANNILLYTVYRLREHCYIYDEQAQLKFSTLTINVVTGGGQLLPNRRQGQFWDWCKSDEFSKMGVGVEAKDWCVWEPRTEQPCQCRECQWLITATQSSHSIEHGGTVSRRTANKKLATKALRNSQVCVAHAVLFWNEKETEIGM